jgi:hypothetical protein
MIFFKQGVQMKISLTKTFKALALATTLVSSLASADDIYLGDPAYGGTGCPAGTASVTLSPDSKSLSILFDEYMAEAGGRKTMSRKSCNIAVPVHVPQGFSVSVIDVDYRGFNSLPRGAQSRFSAEYFFAGKRGPKFVKSFRGPLDDEFLLESNLTATALVWSACGADVNLRVNTSMLVRTNRMRDMALATVDSADMNAGLVYHLKWKRCGNERLDDDFGYSAPDYEPEPIRNPFPRRRYRY